MANPESIICLKFPVEIDNGLYASEITDNFKAPVVIQSSRVFWDKTNVVQLDNAHNRKGIEAFYDKVKDVESRVCEQISKNSETWFGTELEFGVVQNSLFNTALKVPSRFNEPFSMYVETNSKELSIYDAKKRPRTIEDIGDGCETTVLLHAKRVVLSSMSAHIDWEILQVLIHKKKTVIKLAELSIQEEPEEHVPGELFPKKKVSGTKTKKRSCEEPKNVSKPVVEKPAEKVETKKQGCEEPEELVVEEVVREPIEVPVERDPEFDVEIESVTESVEELEPTPAKFVLEE